MKTMLLLFVVAIVGISIGSYRESIIDPYQPGMHWEYSIECENGFVYKSIHRRGTIQIFNSDGTPLKCGEKIY